MSFDTSHTSWARIILTLIAHKVGLIDKELKNVTN